MPWRQDRGVSVRTLIPAIALPLAAPSEAPAPSSGKGVEEKSTACCAKNRSRLKRLEQNGWETERLGATRKQNRGKANAP